MLLKQNSKAAAPDKLIIGAECSNCYLSSKLFEIIQTNNRNRDIQQKILTIRNGDHHRDVVWYRLIYNQIFKYKLIRTFTEDVVYAQQF